MSSMSAMGDNGAAAATGSCSSRMIQQQQGQNQKHRDDNYNRSMDPKALGRRDHQRGGGGSSSVKKRSNGSFNAVKFQDSTASRLTDHASEASGADPGDDSSSVVDPTGTTTMTMMRPGAAVAVFPSDCTAIDAAAPCGSVEMGDNVDTTSSSTARSASSRTAGTTSVGAAVFSGADQEAAPLGAHSVVEEGDDDNDDDNDLTVDSASRGDDMHHSSNDADERRGDDELLITAHVEPATSSAPASSSTPQDRQDPPQAREEQPNEANKARDRASMYKMLFVCCVAFLIPVAVVGGVVVFVVMVRAQQQQQQRGTTARAGQHHDQRPPAHPQKAPTSPAVPSSGGINATSSLAPQQLPYSVPSSPSSCGGGLYYYTYGSTRSIGFMDVTDDSNNNVNANNRYLATPTPDDCTLRYLAFNGNGTTLYGICTYFQSERKLVTVDLPSGKTTEIIALPSIFYRSLAYNPADDGLYTNVGKNKFNGRASLVRIDTRNWTLTKIGGSPLALGERLRSFAIDPDGNAYGTVEDRSLYSVDLKAGTKKLLTDALPYPTRNIAFRGSELYGIGLESPEPLFRIVVSSSLSGEDGVAVTVTTVKESSNATQSIGGSFCPL